MAEFKCMFVQMVEEGVVPVFEKASAIGSLTASSMKDAAEKAFDKTRLNPRPGFVVIKTVAGTKKVFSSTLGEFTEFTLVGLKFPVPAGQQDNDTPKEVDNICKVCGKRFTGEVCRAPHFTQRSQVHAMDEVCTRKCINTDYSVRPTVRCQEMVTRTVADHIAKHNRCDVHAEVWAAQIKINTAKAKA